MTIEKTPTCICCDYCKNCDYYFGNKKSVVEQAKSNGWFVYKEKHFDTEECLQQYLHRKRVEV